MKPMMIRQEEFPLSRRDAKARREAHPNPPPEPKSDTVNTNTTKSASFLDDVVYSHHQVIIELAITLKSNKAFKEFTQALMALLLLPMPRWWTQNL